MLLKLINDFSLSISIMFSIAPLVSPDVEQVTRQTPSIGLVNWTTLMLSESRGFITNYTVTYSESTSSLSCYDTINARTITVTDTWVQLTELDIQKPYCVSVSAVTVAGQGPQSIRELIPSKKRYDVTIPLLTILSLFM